MTMDFAGVPFSHRATTILNGAAERLRQAAHAARGFQEWEAPFRLTYAESVAIAGARRDDELNARLPGRLSLESRSVEQRLEGLRRVLSSPWPPNTGALVRDVHGALFVRTDPHAAGRFRATDLALGPAHAADVPELRLPAAGDIAGELSALDGALSSLPQAHPVARVACRYAGLVLVHPFRDGNGRSARTIAEGALVHEGLLDRPVLSVEPVLRTYRRRTGYLLADIRRAGAVEPFVVFFAVCLMELCDASTRTFRARIGTVYREFQ